MNEATTLQWAREEKEERREKLREKDERLEVNEGEEKEEERRERKEPEEASGRMSWLPRREGGRLVWALSARVLELDRPGLEFWPCLELDVQSWERYSPSPNLSFSSTKWEK